MCGARCTRSLLASEMKSSRRIYLEKRRKSCEWETITIIIYQVSCVQFAYISLSHPPFGTVCGAWSTFRCPTPERGTEWRIKCWLSVVSCARLQNWNCRISIMLLCECHTNQRHGIVAAAQRYPFHIREKFDDMLFNSLVTCTLKGTAFRNHYGYTRVDATVASEWRCWEASFICWAVICIVIFFVLGSQRISSCHHHARVSSHRSNQSIRKLLFGTQLLMAKRMRSLTLIRRAIKVDSPSRKGDRFSITADDGNGW